ncbi:hypothetical protein CRE_17227 [Caenorhabditis remanei]|uniref:SXP/RAL-2 family protein Ani s 5-like cation-binding domain-containing protein n=1 Tax=Caenorhabditis remanei TaxID=31234 RepID=E3MA71_CAERE|nr:hypothetical protein CRE_17227 [Caenorhabditis remanei]
MKRVLIFLLFVLTASVLAKDSRINQLFWRKFTPRAMSSTTEAPGEFQKNMNMTNAKEVMDVLNTLVKVQRDQANIINVRDAQSEEFEKKVMNFMDQTTDVLQKLDKKIKMLQRIFHKIASDIEE